MPDSSKFPNVLIPITLFKKIIELLEYWDISNYDLSIQDDYRDILDALRAKQESMDLRNTYTKIILAKDEDQRHMARMNYLQHKRRLFDDPC